MNINLPIAFLAGMLTTLSPCVLPVLPFVTASSLAKNKFGPLALALGLLVTFVSATLLVSTYGQIFGISPSVLKKVSGVFLAMGGLLFVSAKLSDKFAQALSLLTRRSGNISQPDSHWPIFTEFLGGLLLGIVWTPCSGPSLGIALGLATQAGGIAPAAIILVVFGLGSILPLLLYAYGARNVIGKISKKRGLISGIKKLFGIFMLLFGFLIIFGLDRALEAILNQALPESWLNFITRF